MAKQKPQLPLIKQSNVPFEVTAQMRFYFPICDENPYAAYLLDYCYGQRTISLYEYQQKCQQEREGLESRLAEMSPDEREEELDRINDAAVEKWENQQLNVYQGEAYLNEEEDALEGADGIFDFSMQDAVDTAYDSLFNIAYESPSGKKIQREELEQRLWEAYRLLGGKGFLRLVALSVRLDLGAIEGALRAFYPELYELKENDEKQRRKRESTKVQYHVNMARRLGLPSTLTLPEWMETLSYFEWKCAYCRKASYAVLEHVQPMIAGGGTIAFNCVPACARCNLLKLDTPLELLPLGFDAALEKIQHYLKEKKLRYLQNHENEY